MEWGRRPNPACHSGGANWPPHKKPPRRRARFPTIGRLCSTLTRSPRAAPWTWSIACGARAISSSPRPPADWLPPRWPPPLRPPAMAITIIIIMRPPHPWRPFRWRARHLHCRRDHFHRPWRRYCSGNAARHGARPLVVASCFNSSEIIPLIIFALCLFSPVFSMCSLFTFLFLIYLRPS